MFLFRPRDKGFDKEDNPAKMLSYSESTQCGAEYSYRYLEIAPGTGKRDLREDRLLSMGTESRAMVILTSCHVLYMEVN